MSFWSISVDSTFIPTMFTDFAMWEKFRKCPSCSRYTCEKSVILFDLMNFTHLLAVWLKYMQNP